MTRLQALASIAFALACTHVVAQDCPEPSALDLGAVRELTVQRSGPDELRIEWEDVMASRYELRRGFIDRFFDPPRDPQTPTYSHSVIVESLTASATLEMAEGDRYFLVTNRCREERSSAGRDAFDVERPVGREALVTIGVTWTGAVEAAAVGVRVNYPNERFVTEDDLIEFIGPLADGGLQEKNARVPGVIRFSSTVFPRTFPAPAEVYRFAVTYYEDPAPVPADFQLEDCVITDDRGNELPGMTCEVVDVSLIP